ncbi:MAG: DNA polymerase IV [Syntrophorhabdaceae bacterium]|nr:DNA polymerase IV [Syntrophorhabdaceae bacterium]MDD4197648.1 DNA polymerase IV [Syntrophorhabdaceae bacterium]HOC45354.1 DNA polymerase IV [Syntrophorhabdaceae bacterium]
MDPVIMCADMDAFFASIEQRDDPKLRGKPIAVVGSGERTVLATCSYEARQYGVKTAMTPGEAKRLCPNIIFVTGDHGKYRTASRQMEQICLKFTPNIEVYSIDEVFLDVTRSHHLFEGPINMARTLKDTVKSELGVTCTIGIGPNILIAKLASDLAKPDGLRWIDTSEVATVLEDLPIKKLWGVGPKTEKKLKIMGITTAGQLGRTSLALLIKRFGTLGRQLHAAGSGVLKRPLEINPGEPRSIGHSITLSQDIWERDEINACLLRLSEMVGQRARRHGRSGNKIALTIRYGDFTTFSRQTTLPLPTNDTGDIYKAAIAVLDKVRLQKSIRLLGVTLSGIDQNGHQMALFDENERQKKKALFQAVDKLNERFGQKTITFATTLASSKIKNKDEREE